MFSILPTPPTPPAVQPVSIYDIARIGLVFVGAAGIGWAIVTAQPPTIFAVILPSLAGLMAYLTSEETKTVTAQGVAVLADKVEVIHTATNSMKDALVASTAKASFAEGQAAGPGVPVPVSTTIALPLPPSGIDPFLDPATVKHNATIKVLRDTLASLEAK